MFRLNVTDNILPDLIARFEALAQANVNQAAHDGADSLRAAAPNDLLRRAVYVRTPDDSGYDAAVSGVRDVARSEQSIDALHTVQPDLPTIVDEVAQPASGDATIGFATLDAAVSNYGSIAGGGSVGWIDRAVNGRQIDISANVNEWLGE